MSANVDQFWSPSVNFDGWIELYNPTSDAVTMAGIYMSDDPSNLKKWKAPSSFGFIPAHGYKVVWFDNTHLSNTNTNFKLDTDGGTIYISDANGQLITSQAFPEAMERISYARKTDGGEEWGFTATPTPGTTNNNCDFATQQLDIPKVSHNDQIFTGNITVRIETPEGVTLRYTTDGTLPTLTNGMTSSTGRFVVSRTTCYSFQTPTSSTATNMVYWYAVLVGYPVTGSPHLATGTWTGSALSTLRICCRESLPSSTKTSTLRCAVDGAVHGSPTPSN